VARDGKTLALQDQATQDEFRNTWGDQADAEWVRQHNAEPTPPPPTPTLKPLPTNTPVPTATPSSEERSKSAQPIDIRLLEANPNAYKGQNVVLYGKVTNASVTGKETWAQMTAQLLVNHSVSATSRSWATDNSSANKYISESVALHLYNLATPLLSQECYTIYGTVNGSENVTRTLTGATNTVPGISVYLYQQGTKDQYGLSCQPLY
jgi:hypothetical protein